MSTPRRVRTTSPETSRRYSTAVLGDGRILPIVETLGRRLIREIDPVSVEGRSLLDSGRVTLWFNDGASVRMAPIQQVLDQIHSEARRRREAYPGMPSWTAHHDKVLKSIGRAQRTYKSRH